jgi:hypothetical protein
MLRALPSESPLPASLLSLFRTTLPARAGSAATATEIPGA